MKKVLITATAFLLIGAGCLPFGEKPPEIAADEVDLHVDASFVIEQNWLGLNVRKNENGYGERNVTIDEWVAGESVSLSWTMTERAETAESKAARAAAATAPIGSAVVMPDPIYQDTTTAGTVTTDALNNAERILLPSYWPSGDYDVSDEGNSVAWLSRQQYDELVTTRTSHIALGLFDSTIQEAIDFGESAKSALSKLQGELAAKEEQSNTDVTRLTANADWGEYTMQVNGETRTVQTIRASNMFANYVVLANADNPLILQVSVKPWSLGIGMLNVLGAVNALAGYRVTSIVY